MCPLFVVISLRAILSVVSLNLDKKPLLLDISIKSVRRSSENSGSSAALHNSSKE
jgi:hypothetical protein